jgi:poly-gamma-glutamate synthesis protein (capsule biosynthesis protein)
VRPGPRTIRIAFTGDTLPHSPLWRQAERNAEPGDDDDFRPMLTGLRPIIAAADLAVCHLETPIAPLGEEPSTSPFYGVPAGIVDAIAAAGYDRCSTASNHTADRGTAGVDRTVDVLEAAGVAQSGMARRPAEIEPTVFDVDGVAVSHLSYTFSYNGLSFPADESWRSATIDPVRIRADAQTARDRGAEVVIVSMHWGAEGVHEPTSGQRRIADEITAGGLIDLVVGHHAHVVQPIEMVNDTWVLFGLGNILSNLPTSSRWPAASQDAAVVTVEVTVDTDGDVTVARPVAHPTWVDKDAGWIVRLVDRELDRSDISPGQRGRLERSRERTERVLAPFMTEAGVA